MRRRRARIKEVPAGQIGDRGIAGWHFPNPETLSKISPTQKTAIVTPNDFRAGWMSAGASRRFDGRPGRERQVSA
jgi:hypothetical protein